MTQLRDETRWQNPRLVGRIPELDGIRGLAILAVVLYHYVFLAVVGRPDWHFTPLLIFRLGWSGVDLFFVLSGFLIGGILLDAKHSRNYYRTFYLRRFYRIVPLYAVSICIFIAGVAAVDGKGPLAEIFNRRLPLWSFPLFLQNILMAQRHYFGSGWMAVTWSLAIEEQFYLLLPLVVRRLSPKGTVLFGIGMVVGAPVLRMLMARHGISSTVMYILLPCRADALGAGFLVAIACRNQAAWEWLVSHRKYFRAAFAILAVCVLFLSVVETREYTCMAAFYVTLLILVVVNPGPTELFVFRSVPFVRLGTVAYSIYLFHFGIYCLCSYFLITRPDAWLTIAVTLFSCVLVALLSTISWDLLEKPLIRWASARFQYLHGGITEPKAL